MDQSMTLQIEKPTAVLNAATAKRNIARMAEKARKSGVRFRPHFKSHQSAIIGEWFREAGVEVITTSSVSMARYFANHGWQDITVAFPVNWLEIDRINELAMRVQLNLLVESPETVRFLQEKLVRPIHVWLKIDAGYNRTGIKWDDAEALRTIAKFIQAADKLTLQGGLAHSGNSYSVDNQADIRAIYRQTVERLKAVRDTLTGAESPGFEISIGDTPCCAVVDDFGEVDEVRPGVFVFFDLMQLQIGSCQYEDIAVAVACPVVAKHPEKNTIITYGGAVHLSKEALRGPDTGPTYGAVAMPAPEGWSELIPDTYVAGVSQEHGIVKTTAAFLERVHVGDVLMIIPVHACLTMNLLKRYQTLSGEIIPMAGI
jgi:D-serine deaminase-like pyridoxal phosphate-dependent protein